MDEFKKIQEMPNMQKAEEIYQLVEGLATLIPEDEDDILGAERRFMREDAMIIPAKIMGAEAADIYDLRMENAAIIRKAAREIYVRAGSLDMYGFDQTEYADLIRKEIDNFKLLFREWVKSFDPWNYIVDDWGLFNPPGIEAGEDE